MTSPVSAIQSLKKRDRRAGAVATEDDRGRGFIGDIPRGGLGEEAASLDRLFTLSVPVWILYAIFSFVCLRS
jgi:hypothetical protein